MEHEELNERIINLRSGPRRVRLDRKATKRRSSLEKQEKPYETPETLNTAERVFGIEELCEMILSNLPPRDVLVTRRVSRAFANAIQGSQDLKRQAFLVPVEVTDNRAVKLNDMIFSKSAQPAYMSAKLPWLKWLKITGLRAGSIVQMRQQLREEDIVGKMFVTQPPISTVHIMLLQESLLGRKWDITEVELLSGVTVGDVVRGTSRLKGHIGDRVNCITLGLDHGIEVVSTNQEVSWREQFQFYMNSKADATG